MCRLGSESDNSDGSYVVTAPGSGFTVTQENVTPHLSPNPRNPSKSSFANSNGNLRWVTRNKIRDLFKVKLYAIRSENKKEREKKRER